MVALGEGAVSYERGTPEELFGTLCQSLGVSGEWFGFEVGS